jgi:hypothetical protein
MQRCSGGHVPAPAVHLKMEKMAPYSPRLITENRESKVSQKLAGDSLYRTQK